MHETDSPSDSLHGAAAVVTGSSSGIGRAIAIELAAAGARCMVHAGRNRDGAEETVTLIRDAGGVADSILSDLRTSEGTQDLLTHTQKWSDDISIWINNAGADVLTGSAVDQPFDDKLQTLWEVDVLSTIRLSRSIGAAMKTRGRGVILNMGWDQAESGMEGDSGQMFATAKGAIIAFTKSLAKTLAPQVRVNCLAPGWIRTEWGQRAPKRWDNRARRESLLRRWGTPEDVAAMARFLVSPDAAFINGQVISINGGAT